jgi:hypothetical protein
MTTYSELCPLHMRIIHLLHTNWSTIASHDMLRIMLNARPPPTLLICQQAGRPLAAATPAAQFAAAVQQRIILRIQPPVCRGHHYCCTCYPAFHQVASMHAAHAATDAWFVPAVVIQVQEL